MRRNHTTFGLAFAAAIAGIGAVPQTLEPSAVVKDRYLSPDLGEIRVLGACNVREDAISCWDPQRHVNDSLTKQVIELLAKSTRPGSDSGSSIPFRFQHKSRLVIFQTRSAIGQKVGLTRFAGIRNANGFFLPTIGTPRGSADPNGIQCAPVEVDGHASKTSLDVCLEQYVGPSMSLRPRPGASGSIGKETVSIQSIERSHSPGWQSHDTAQMASWTVRFRITPDDPRLNLRLEADALGKNGTAVTWADKTGRPVEPPVPPQQNINDWYSWAHPVMRSNILGLTNDREGQGRRAWIINVDPNTISGIRLSLKTWKAIEFKDIPLDPKS